jgi:hypothetical protein
MEHNFCTRLDFEIGEVVYIVGKEERWQISRKTVLGFSITQSEKRPLFIQYEIAQNNFWPSERVFRTVDDAADWIRKMSILTVKN